MELINITTNKCPICGCDIIVNEYVETFNNSIRVHSNGTRWEHRNFLCGTEISYIPNFNKECLSGKCVNDKQYINYLKKVSEDKDKLLAYCKDNDIDESIVEKLTKYIL